MTLAMIRPNQTSLQNFEVGRDYISSGYNHSSSILIPKHYSAKIKAPKADQPKQAEVLVNENQVRVENSYSPGVFSIFRMNTEETNRGNLWAHVQAGYGQIWQDESIVVRGKNGTAWEQPSCGYLKATFSF